MTVVDGSAWDQFCDRLKEAGRSVLRPECPSSEFDRADGYHHLLGYVWSEMTRTLYDSGPEHPSFVRSMSDVARYGGDAPDGHNSYSATIRDDIEYRLWGVAAHETYVGWQVMGPMGTLHNASLDEYELAPDGSFEIIASRQPRGGNWLPLPGGATSIMQRQFHYDWTSEEYAEIHIATLEPRPGLPACLGNFTPDDVTSMLDSLGQRILGMSNFWVDFVHGFRAEGDNVAPTPIFNSSIGGNATQLASNGYWEVRRGQALLIEFRPPEARYWSVVLSNFWFGATDLHHHQGSLNGFQAALDEDGLCRMVLTHEDPGVANWLDPFDHEVGTVTFRWLLSDRAPDVSMTLIPANQVDSRLPTSTRRVTAAERRAGIAERIAEASKRWGGPLTSRWYAESEPSG